MNKKLLLVIWMIGLIFSSGFTPISVSSNTESNNQPSFTAAGNTHNKLIWSMTNRSKNRVTFTLQSADSSFRMIVNVAAKTKRMYVVTLSPGNYTVSATFHDPRCKSIKKNFKVTKHVRNIAITATCGKF